MKLFNKVDKSSFLFGKAKDPRFRLGGKSSQNNKKHHAHGYINQEKEHRSPLEK
jgi:hypothetical protein